MTSFLRFGVKTMPVQVRISRPRQPWAIEPGIVYLSTLSAFRRLISRRVIPAAMFAFAAISASAADFDTGFAAYDRGEHAVAVQEFQGLANEGHAGTQNQLARMFSKGQVVTKDNRKAAKWYKLAAEQGILRAQVELG